MLASTFRETLCPLIFDLFPSSAWLLSILLTWQHPLASGCCCYSTSLLADPSSQRPTVELYPHRHRRTENQVYLWIDSLHFSLLGIDFPVFQFARAFLRRIFPTVRPPAKSDKKDQKKKKKKKIPRLSEAALPQKQNPTNQPHEALQRTYSACIFTYPTSCSGRLLSITSCLAPLRP